MVYMPLVMPEVCVVDGLVCVVQGTQRQPCSSSMGSGG